MSVTGSIFLSSSSAFVFSVLVGGEPLSQVFVRMMQRDQPVEMQLTAAKWQVTQNHKSYYLPNFSDP